MVDFESLPLGYALKQAQHALHRRFEAALKPLDLTPAQYAILRELAVRPDQTNAGLADAAFLTPQSMQGVLVKLEKAGLLERTQDRDHGRKQLARLTDRGAAKTAQAEAVIRPIEDDLDVAAQMPRGDALALILRLRDAMLGAGTPADGSSRRRI